MGGVGGHTHNTSNEKKRHTVLVPGRQKNSNDVRTGTLVAFFVNGKPTINAAFSS